MKYDMLARSAPPSHTAGLPPLWIASHVRACRSEDQVILLDLRRNRYVGIKNQHLFDLLASAGSQPDNASASPPEVTSYGPIAASLLASGLLTDRPTQRDDTAQLEPASQSLDTDGFNIGSGNRSLQCLRMIGCAIQTAVSLRYQTLECVVKHVAARRMHFESTIDLQPQERLVAAVASYDRLRPLLFTKKARCLHESLTLIHYLARERIFPRWVIGVRVAPFGAHSWVQAGPLVLNDLHERVRQFQPILVV